MLNCHRWISFRDRGNPCEIRAPPKLSQHFCKFIRTSINDGGISANGAMMPPSFNDLDPQLGLPSTHRRPSDPRGHHLGTSGQSKMSVDELSARLKRMEEEVNSLHTTLEGMGKNSKQIKSLDLANRKGTVFAVPVDEAHKATQDPLCVTLLNCEFNPRIAHGHGDFMPFAHSCLCTPFQHATAHARPVACCCAPVKPSRFLSHHLTTEPRPSANRCAQVRSRIWPPSTPRGSASSRPSSRPLRQLRSTHTSSRTLTSQTSTGATPTWRPSRAPSSSAFSWAGSATSLALARASASSCSAPRLPSSS